MPLVNLTDEQYTEKAYELLGMIDSLRNALFHNTMAEGVLCV